MSATPKPTRISEAEAIVIAVRFVKLKGGAEVKWEAVKAYFCSAGQDGVDKDRWEVVFPWDLQPNVISSPDMSVVLVDASSGEAEWLEML